VADPDFEGAAYFQNPYAVMSDLYEIARRQALGLEQAVDELLNELDDIPF
jgi:hypothetical protein